MSRAKQNRQWYAYLIIRGFVRAHRIMPPPATMKRYILQAATDHGDMGTQAEWEVGFASAYEVHEIEQDLSHGSEPA